LSPTINTITLKYYCKLLFIAVVSLNLFVSCTNHSKTNDAKIISKTKRTYSKQHAKKATSHLVPTINKKNVIPFLTEYGKNNPETEVLLSTRLGDITIKLFKNTPLYRANFIYLTKTGYFNTTCFHRIVPNFIIQGGDSDSRKTAELRAKYKNYLLPANFNKKNTHKRGAVSAARSWDNNPLKNSSPFEFFIVLNKNGAHHLDGEHTVFGKVIKGFDVIDKISKVKAGKDEWPYEDVDMTITVIK